MQRVLAAAECVEVVVGAVEAVHLEETLGVGELHHELALLCRHAALYEADPLG